MNPEDPIIFELIKPESFLIRLILEACDFAIHGFIK